ncbi:kinesin-like protein KIN-7N [Hibiscus syriacus]|uniref:kinesin-like protein KIN-7N n=1 Tax=Hibiscus syriacus TaxID=106335 RepID=UPI001922F8D3|nr:kinesin-like protein KIN-7N [Hibiscus syriacus]
MGEISELKQELDVSNNLLEVSKERYGSLEREFQLLKEEENSLRKSVSESSQKLKFVTDQKENILKEMKYEVQRRKDLETEIKKFSVAFASRQRSLASIHGEFKSKIEKLGAENPVPLHKSVQY